MKRFWLDPSDDLGFFLVHVLKWIAIICLGVVVVGSTVRYFQFLFY